MPAFIEGHCSELYRNNPGHRPNRRGLSMLYDTGWRFDRDWGVRR